jgi:2-keto-4-pentenoate hydratase/2-oxohepta-3-ene-1,7-dioic acid hydratase in catechol pathway
VELALQLGDNLDIVAATIALDLTARDLQNELKKKGRPWTAAKAFKNACALGPWQPVESISELESLEITLHVNGVLRQKGCLANLIFPVDQLINYLRHRYPMRSGDLILTGTPAGVGPIYPGDRLRAEASNGVKCEWIVESI